MAVTELHGTEDKCLDSNPIDHLLTFASKHDQFKKQSESVPRTNGWTVVFSTPFSAHLPKDSIHFNVNRFRRRGYHDNTT